MKLIMLTKCDDEGDGYGPIWLNGDRILSIEVNEHLVTVIDMGDRVYHVKQKPTDLAEVLGGDGRFEYSAQAQPNHDL